MDLVISVDTDMRWRVSCGSGFRGRQQYPYHFRQPLDLDGMMGQCGVDLDVEHKAAGRAFCP